MAGSHVVLPRFELELKEPKTLVLPLHHKTIFLLQTNPVSKHLQN